MKIFQSTYLIPVCLTITWCMTLFFSKEDELKNKSYNQVTVIPTLPFSWDEASYLFFKKGMLQDVLPVGYDIYCAKSADLNMDGISDIVALRIRV